jgi:hypothetical protein
MASVCQIPPGPPFSKGGAVICRFGPGTPGGALFFMTTQKKILKPSIDNPNRATVSESFLSYLIIGLLCLIAFGVYRYHFNYNPAVLALEKFENIPN